MKEDLAEKAASIVDAWWLKHFIGTDLTTSMSGRLWEPKEELKASLRNALAGEKESDDDHS